MERGKGGKVERWEGEKVIFYAKNVSLFCKFGCQFYWAVDMSELLCTFDVMTKSQFLIGASSSGSGKTTLTIGLLRALKNRGIQVQPFKCGPDYIDTKFHELAAGKPSINLDLFLSSQEHVKQLYSTYTSSCDVALTEGVMGLFDGYHKWQGSGAHIAGLLDIPVILVLTPQSMAYSVAPILYGFKNFHKDISIAGVIFNMVNSDSHYRFLQDACNDVGIPALGRLPKNNDLKIPSRHLGLNIDRNLLLDEFAEKAAGFMEQHLPIDEILERTIKSTITQDPVFRHKPFHGKPLISAVASDEAFTFCYHENIEYLKNRGTVTFFSPMHDKELPDADFVYLPGGYPELYLDKLSENKSMQESIRRYVEQGGRLLAECGGMMYLSSCIADKTGKEYPMAGIFKQKASMEGMKLTLGYRQFTSNGICVKGHEFHYSSVSGDEASILTQYNAREIPVDTKLLRYKNTIAGYTHIYWAEMDDLMGLFNQEKHH